MTESQSTATNTTSPAQSITPTLTSLNDPHTRNNSVVAPYQNNGTGDSMIDINSNDTTDNYLPPFNTGNRNKQYTRIKSTQPYESDRDPLNGVHTQYGAKRRAHWSIYKKLCFVSCIITAMSLLTLIVLIIFLVRTPTVKVGNVQVQCQSYVTCIKTGLPISVDVLVDNDNIIGAQVSGPVFLYTETGVVLSNGSITPAYVSSRSVTELTADFVVPVSAQVVQLALQVILLHKNYTVNVTADINLNVAAINTQLVYNTTYILTPSTFSSIGLSQKQLLKQQYTEYGLTNYDDIDHELMDRLDELDEP